MKKKTYSKTRRNFAIGFAIVLGAAIITTPIICRAESPSNLYPETGIITAIEFADDNSECLLEITVANGNQFCYYTENIDYYINDLVSMLMDSNGTDIVYDDEILKIEYSGVLEHLAQYVK